MPGIVFLPLGLFLRTTGRIMFWTVPTPMAVHLLTVLISVAGDGATTQIVLPVAALVLLLRRRSRSFFLGPAPLPESVSDRGTAPADAAPVRPPADFRRVGNGVQDGGETAPCENGAG